MLIQPTSSYALASIHNRVSYKTLVLASLALASIAHDALAEFSFRAIPELGESVIKLSADGRVLIGTTRDGTVERAGYWTEATGLKLLPSLSGGDGSGNAFGVSSDGRFIVGRASTGSGSEAFIWSAENGMRTLGDLPAGGAFNSAALAVAADGSVVVGYSLSTSTRRAFRWTPTLGMTDLGSLGGATTANAITPDGRVIVGDSMSSLSQEAFILDAGGMRALGALPQGGRTVRATATSTDGGVVVGVGVNSSFMAFRWTELGGPVELGMLDPHNAGSSASAVSGDGTVIVGLGSGADADGNGEAFVWFPSSGMQDLRKYLMAHGIAELQGWRLSEGSGISADGKTICGFGIMPDGHRAAWIATIDIIDVAPPSPPPAMTPAAPSDLRATATSSEVSLAWRDNSTNEDGFVVERCTASNCLSFALIAQTAANSTRFVDSKRARNTVYRYRVRAVNGAGNSAYSNIVTVQTPRK